MGLYEQFKTNTDAEVDGVWFPFPQADGTIVELLIARGGGENSAYKRELRRLLRKFKKARDIPIEQYHPARDELCHVMGELLLKGWRTRDLDNKVQQKIINGEGKMVGYSATRAKRLLLDLPELREEISFKATDFTNFQEGIEPEEIEKN